MEKEAVGSITKHFGELQDPRTGNAKAHIFLEILIIAICAVICGADGWSDIELFGKNKKDWLKTFLELRHFVCVEGIVADQCGRGYQSTEHRKGPELHPSYS